MRAVMDGNLVRLTLPVSLPQGNARIGSVFSQDVVRHVNETQPVHVSVVVAHNALEGVQAGFLWRHSVAHVFDNSVRTRDFDVLFPASGSAGRAHVLIGVAARADDRRIAAASRQLEGKTARCRAAGNLSLIVQRGAMNSAGRSVENLSHRGELKL